MLKMYTVYRCGRALEIKTYWIFLDLKNDHFSIKFEYGQKDTTCYKPLKGGGNIWVLI